MSNITTHATAAPIIVRRIDRLQVSIMSEFPRIPQDVHGFIDPRLFFYKDGKFLVRKQYWGNQGVLVTKTIPRESNEEIARICASEAEWKKVTKYWLEAQLMHRGIQSYHNSKQETLSQTIRALQEGLMQVPDRIAQIERSEKALHEIQEEVEVIKSMETWSGSVAEGSGTFPKVEDNADHDHDVCDCVDCFFDRTQLE